MRKRVGAVVAFVAMCMASSAVASQHEHTEGRRLTPTHRLEIGRAASASTSPQAALNETADVWRCKTSALFNAETCFETRLATPFDASAFDYGIGAKFIFDYIVTTYQLRFTAPGGSTIYYATWTKRPQNDAFCPGGYVKGDIGGNSCDYDRQGWIVYVKQRPGQWKIELLEDSAVRWTAYSNVKPAEIRKISGDGQAAPINEALRIKPTFSLYHFDGTPIDVAESSAGVNTDVVTFAIAGPSKATGMMVNSVSYPWHATSAPLSVSLGSKAGLYTVTSTGTKYQTPSPFTFSAVGRVEPPDQASNEEGIGPECCEIGDPIAIGIGNSVQTEIDYPRAGISPLEFARTYNSKGSKSRLTRNYWSTTFDRFVVPPSSPELPAKLRRSDGRTISFFGPGPVYRPRDYFELVLTKTATGWSLLDSDGSTEIFDATGRLLSFTNADGAAVMLTYGTSGAITKAAASTGEFLNFTYNADGLLASITDGLGRLWTYKYNGYSALTIVSRPSGRSRSYWYKDLANPNLLTAAQSGTTSYGSDEYADVWWEYDPQGRVVANYFRGGLKKQTITYPDADTRVVTDSLNRQTTYKFVTAHGKAFLAEIRGPSYAQFGLPDIKIEYDAQMNVTAKTQFGRRTEFQQFDSKGQYGIAIEAAGTVLARTIQFQYDPRFIGRPTRISVPSVFGGAEKVVSRVYSGTGKVLSLTVSGFAASGTPVSATTSYEYSGPYKQLSKLDGPRTDVSDVFTFLYDTQTKRLIRMVGPTGIVERDQIAYALDGKISSELRPNGLRAAYSFLPGTNLPQSVLKTVGSKTLATTWDYDDRRRLISHVRSDGSNPAAAVGYSYSYADDLVEVTNPGTTYQVAPGWPIDPARMEFGLDSEGNRISTKRMAGGTVFQWNTRSVDPYDHDWKEQTVLGETTKIVDPEGKLLSASDSSGRQRVYVYDALGRVERITNGNEFEHFEYDVQGNVVLVQDARAVSTTYEYDDLGRRTKANSPNSGETNFTYDAVGNLTRSTDHAGRETIWRYDALNRTTHIDRPGTSDDETYVYDSCGNGVGKLCSVTSTNQEFQSYSYDGFGRISQSATLNGIVGFEYDASDNVTRIVYPSGRSVRYVRNSAQQVESVSVTDASGTYPLASGIRNLPFGPADKWQYGNGQSERRAFNQAYLPTELGVDGAGKVLLTSYDPYGNVLARSVAGVSESFTYDAHDRLKSANTAGGTFAVEYDNSGNRVQLTSDGVSKSYSYGVGSNRLTTIDGVDTVLDVTGNVVEFDNPLGRVVAGYSAHHRLTSSYLTTDPTAVSVNSYDSRSRRVASIDGQGVEKGFVYDESGQLLAEVDAQGEVLQEYVYLNGQLLALLNKPSVISAPPLVDVIVDDPIRNAPWVLKNAQYAYGGKYQQLTVSAPYNNDFVWNWAAPYSGYYDIWTMWNRRPSDGTATIYTIDGGYSLSTVTHAQQTQGAWTYLGRHHLRPDRLAIALDEWRASAEASLDGKSNSGGALYADAVRFKLIQHDTGNEASFYYAQSDQVGLPIVLVDKSLRVVWRANYSPFGEAQIIADPDGDGLAVELNLRFPGQFLDAHTGLAHNNYRAYDAYSGRYLQVDPLGLDGGSNEYEYANGNPLKFVDPMGLEAELVLFQRGITNNYNVLAGRFKSRDGVFTVMAHGDIRSTRDDLNQVILAQDLAKLIRSDPDFPGTKSILLVACETGRGKRGYTYADRLSHYLGIPVVAPSNFVFATAEGKMFLGEANRENLKYIPGTTGQWNTYCDGDCRQ